MEGNLAGNNGKKKSLYCIITIIYECNNDKTDSK